MKKSSAVKTSPGERQGSHRHDSSEATWEPARPSKAELIIDATIALMAENGVSGLTVDGVAAAARVSKPTIYRYWESRARLIYSAISHMQRPTIEPDTGSLHKDLIALLQQHVEDLNRNQNSRIYQSLIDAAARDPELAQLHQESIRKAQAVFQRVVRRGIERGELPPDVDTRLVVDLLMSPFVFRKIVTQTAIRPTDIPPILDAVLRAFRG
jgi:AcrR family transcriptional regulator